MGLLSNLFGRGSADAKLQDQIFNLKFTAKSLARACGNDGDAEVGFED